MRDLSMHVLDIVQNSIKAGAALVTVTFTVNENRVLTFSVRDDGCGMAPDFLARVTDPFTTTRTTRKVGLGIPMLKQSAEMAGGTFDIRSKLGEGTVVTTTFAIDHIDRPPLGDLGETMSTLISNGDEVDYVLHFVFKDTDFVFDTRELKAQLDGVPMDEPEVLLFIKNYIRENTPHGGLL